jgi:hypothetical protein
MVPEAGVEPARIAPLDFESSASTNFTTPAKRFGSIADASFQVKAEISFFNLQKIVDTKSDPML